MLPAIEQIIASAVQTWPGVWIEPAVFEVYALERAEHEGALADIHGDDLYLAASCALGDARAAAWLDRAFLRALPGRIASVGLAPDVADELVQRLRERLLLGNDGHAPHIASYAGRGRLAGWLRMVAVRDAVRIKRRRRPAPIDVTDDTSVAADPEALGTRARLRQPLRDAVSHGIATLDERDRRLLQLSVIEGVQARTLARRFGVHESTISRWLVRAHASLRRVTRGYLQESLAVPSGELESILRAFDGRFSATTGTVWPAESVRTEEIRGRAASGSIARPRSG